MVCLSAQYTAHSSMTHHRLLRLATGTSPEAAQDPTRQCDEAQEAALQDCIHAPQCRCLDNGQTEEESHLHAALQDVVATLERTRHAFRSRELGQLRKRLELLLGELPAPLE